MSKTINWIEYNNEGKLPCSKRLFQSKIKEWKEKILDWLFSLLNIYKKEINSYRFDRDERLSLSDCEEQMKDWARELVDAEIRRRPEGAKLKQLEQLRQHSIDTVMESGTPEELIKQLDNTTKKIGIAWVVDTSKIKQIGSN